MDFQSEKSFEKLRLRAFQPYAMYVKVLMSKGLKVISTFDRFNMLQYT